jgi:hypothetical protein
MDELYECKKSIQDDVTRYNTLRDSYIEDLQKSYNKYNIKEYYGNKFQIYTEIPDLKDFEAFLKFLLDKGSTVDDIPTQTFDSFYERFKDQWISFDKKSKRWSSTHSITKPKMNEWLRNMCLKFIDFKPAWIQFLKVNGTYNDYKKGIASGNNYSEAYSIMKRAIFRDPDTYSTPRGGSRRTRNKRFKKYSKKNCKSKHKRTKRR